MHNAAQSTKAERNTASIRCSPEGVKNEHRLKNGVSAANDSAPETEAPANMITAESSIEDTKYAVIPLVLHLPASNAATGITGKNKSSRRFSATYTSKELSSAEAEAIFPIFICFDTDSIRKAVIITNSPEITTAVLPQEESSYLRHHKTAAVIRTVRTRGEPAGEKHENLPKTVIPVKIK